MSVSPVELSLCSKHGASSFRSFVFFVLFYLYLRLYVDLRLFYGGGGMITNFPVFFKGWTFFRDLLSHPGGPVEYLSAFLCQLFYIGWAGALVVTMQAWLIFACIGYILRVMNLSGLRWLRFVTPILMLITYTRYTYHFVTTTAFLAALLFLCLYLRAARLLISSLGRLLVFLVLSVVLYYVAAGAYLLLVTLCAIYELLFRRQWLLCLVYLLLAGAVPYVEGVLGFGASIVNAFTDLLPLSWKILSFEGRRRLITIIYVLYLFVPVAMLVSGLWRRVQNQRILVRLASRLRKSKLNAVPPVVKWIAESVVLFGAAFAAVLFSYDAEQKTLFAVQYYACRRMWPQVLQAARRHTGSSFVINAVNRALYHTGRLGYDMFSWPQHPDVLLLTGEDRILACWHKFDTQIDLGLVNMAEKNLTECMEVYGAHPMILKRLALINMVKGNYGSARVYLGALRQTLFGADWAEDYLSRLRSDPNLSADDRIQHLRAVRMEKDYATIFFSREKMLCELLEKNSQNRMAFEYLTAWYMLTRQLEELVENIRRVSDFDYPELPGLYEEAVLIYVYGTKKPVYLVGYQATGEARRRIEHFSEVFNKRMRNKAAAFDELAKDYGDSYFFYHIYGFSGVKK